MKRRGRGIACMWYPIGFTVSANPSAALDLHHTPRGVEDHRAVARRHVEGHRGPEAQALRRVRGHERLEAQRARHPVPGLGRLAGQRQDDNDRDSQEREDQQHPSHHWFFHWPVRWMVWSWR